MLNLLLNLPSVALFWGGVGVAYRLSGLADAFAAAPFTEGGWKSGLDTLAQATGSLRGQLIGIGGPSLIPFNLITHIDAPALEQFVEIEGGSPERNFRVAASGATFEIIHEGHYAAAQSALRDHVYNDFCRDYDLPHGIQTVLQQGDGWMIGLAVNRTLREGVSSADQRQLFAAAIPHALRAVQLQWAMDNQGVALLSKGFEQVSIAAFILDGVGLVRALTSAAEAALGAGLNLRDRRLRMARNDEQMTLDSAILDALGVPARATTLVIGSGADRAPPALITVAPVGLDSGSFNFAPRAVVVVRGRHRNAHSAALIRQAYGLTLAEAEVALALGSGLSREEISVARGVAPATVHAQLKTIFAKLDVGREVELVLKLVRLSAL